VTEEKLVQEVFRQALDRFRRSPHLKKGVSMSEQPYNDSPLDNTVTDSEQNNLGTAKNIPLSSFDHYAIDSGHYFRTLDEVLARFGLVLPGAMLTGGFFGGLFITLPSFFSKKYVDLYSIFTCEGDWIVPTTIDYELEGIIQGSIINIILVGWIIANYKEPLPNKILLTTGLIAGIISFFISSLILRNGFGL